MAALGRAARAAAHALSLASSKQKNLAIHKGRRQMRACAADILARQCAVTWQPQGERTASAFLDRWRSIVPRVEAMAKASMTSRAS